MYRAVKLICGIGCLLLLALARPGRAAGPQGVDFGWTYDDSGNILLTSTAASQVASGETGWIRIEARLIPGHTTWDSTMLGLLDTVVNNARGAGLQVLMLVDYSSWPGSQTDWCANNHENTGGSGDNTYVDNFAANAVVPIVLHLHDRVKFYEIWNEPNAWTSNPSPGVYTGGTFLYPSNFSWALNKSWVGVHKTNSIADVSLLFGGVFGHNIAGYTYSDAGAQYIDDTYNVGINAVGSFSSTFTSYGSYPVDGVAHHVYIDPGGNTSQSEFQQYITWVRSAYTKYEGAATSKKQWITEFGWATNNVSQAIQDSNLILAFKAIEATSYLQDAIWFQWEDNPAAGLYYGVLDANGNPKLSFADYKTHEHYEGYLSAGGATNADIASYFNTSGHAAMGNPYDNGGTAWVHPWGNGDIQDYNGGARGRLGLMDSSAGAHEVNDSHGLWTYYLANGGSTAYGYPLDNEFASGTGTRQDFANGYLTWTSTGGIAFHATAPQSPSGLAASAGKASVKLTWTQSLSTNVTQNKVYRSTTSGGPYSLIATVSATTSYTDTSVSSRVTYDYVVSAVNAIGESAYSAQVSATPR